MGLLDQVDQAPGFAQLNWEEQLEVRMRLLRERLMTQPGWLDLNAAEQNAIIEQVMFRAPIYESGHQANVRGANGGRETFSQATQAVTQGLLQNDRQALNDLRAARGALGLGGSGQNMLGQRIRQSGLMQAITRPINRALTGDPDAKIKEDRDFSKYQRYLAFFADQNEQVMRKGRFAQTVGEIGGAVADFVPLYGGLIGSVANPKGIAKAGQTILTKWAAARGPSLGRLGNFALGRGGQAVVHSVGGGVAEVIRENAVTILDEYSENPSFAEFMTQAPKYFGRGFAWDYVTFGLGGVGRTVLKSVRRSFVGFRPKVGSERMVAAFDDLRPRTRKELMDHIVDGSELPDALFNQLSPQQRLVFTRLRQVGQVQRSLENVLPNSEAEVQVQLARKGWIANKTDEGHWEVFRTFQMNKKIRVEDHEIREFMAKALTTPDEAMTAVLRGQRQQAQREVRRSLGVQSLDTEIDVKAQRVSLPSAERLNQLEAPDGQIKDVWDEMRSLEDQDVVIPVLGGRTGQASDYLTARGLWERAATRSEHVARTPLTFDKYLGAVEHLREIGELSGRADPIQRTAAREAWWMWVPDGAEIFAYRQAADLEANARAAWDSFIYGGRRQGRTLPSARGAITPGEADQMVKAGRGRMATADPANPLIFDVSEGRARPNSVLHVENAAPQRMWDEALAREGGDWNRARNRLVSEGFDGAELAQGRVAVFAPGQIRRISNEALSESSGRLLREVTDLDVARFASSQAPVRIREIVSGRLSGFSGNPMDLAVLLQPRGGRVSRQNVRMFAKAYLLDKGVPGGTVTQRLNDVAPSNWRVETPEDERRLVGELFDVLDDVVEQHGTGEATSAGRASLADYMKSLEQSRTFTPAWVEYAVTKDGGTLTQTADGKWLLQKEGRNTVYDTLDDIVDGIFRQNLSDDHIIQGIRQDLGLEIRRIADGFEIRRPLKGRKAAGSTVMEGGVVRTIDDVLEYTRWKPKLDSRFGPDIAVVDEAATELRYTDRGVVGQYQDVLRELDRFQSKFDAEGEVALSGVDGQIRLDRRTRQYEVYVPQIRHRQMFSTIKQAKDYLNDGWKGFEELEEAALKKGYSLEHFGSGWQLRTAQPGSPVVLAKDLDEVQAALRDVPTPEWGPELSGAVGTEAEEIVSAQQRIVSDGYFQDMDYGPQKKELRGLRRLANHLIRPPDAIFEDALRRTGDPGALNAFRAVEVSARAARSQTQTLQVETERIFGQAKELLGRGKRARMLRQGIMEVAFPSGPGTAEEIFRKWAGQGLTDRHRQIADEWKSFLFRMGEERYGLDPEKFFGSWRRTAREWLHKHRTGDWREAWGGSPPQDVKEWLGELRNADIMDIVRETDPLILSSRYHYIGNKQTLMVDAINEAKALLNETSEEAIQNDAVRQRLGLYLMEVSGLPSTWELSQFRNLGREISAGMPGVGEDRVLSGIQDKLFQRMFHFGYLGTMGWRPWLPIRNQFQIWTTLSLFAPNTVIADALKEVVDAKEGSKIVSELIEKGIVRPFGLPVLGEDLLERGVAGRLATSAHRFAPLASYRTSDEITRAVAYVAARLQYRPAQAKAIRWIREGVDKATVDKRFFQLSGADAMAPDIQNRMRGFIREGKWDTAFDIYANQLIEQTMFPYRAGTSPAAFKGVIGKLFGMFGTYPAYYLENIRRAWRNTPPARRAAVFGRFMGNNLAIFLALQAAGVDAPNNFLPWKQVIFTGGPYYNLMNELLQSLGSGPRSRAARAELIRQVPRVLVPGSLAAQGVIEGIRLIDEGNVWQGMLRALSMPIKREWLDEPESLPIPLVGVANQFGANLPEELPLPVTEGAAALAGAVRFPGQR